MPVTLMRYRAAGSISETGCASLTSVTIGNGVTRIGEWAFEVGDGLLEDVAEDVHVNDRADGGIVVQGCTFPPRPISVLIRPIAFCQPAVMNLAKTQRPAYLEASHV